MMCYKDRTFCEEISCTKFDGCKRALTEEVRIGAQMWWNKCCPKSDMKAPICIFTDRPECYEGRY